LSTRVWKERRAPASANDLSFVVVTSGGLIGLVWVDLDC
jgi:hypothetical protein